MYLVCRDGKNNGFNLLKSDIGLSSCIVIIIKSFITKTVVNYDVKSKLIG